MTATATEKQVNFLMKLAASHDVPAWGTCAQERMDTMGLKIYDEEDRHVKITVRQASEMIDWLRKQPRQTDDVDGETESETVTPGVFEKDGDIYIVKPNRAKTHVYAKRMVPITGERLVETGDHAKIEFEYAPGAIQRLSEADRMPADRAKELTIKYGHCIVCGKFLKAAKSVERGIGPVCIKLIG